MSSATAATIRRNNFDITFTPAAKDRNEFGAYVQDEIFVDRWRFSTGWLASTSSATSTIRSSRRGLRRSSNRRANHSIRVSFNRAFRSPSTINNYLDPALVTPGLILAPLLPSPCIPLASPFPLVVNAVGSELPIGGRPQPPLKEESLTAYEWRIRARSEDRTTFGAGFYINDSRPINFVTLPANLDPYTPANPPPAGRCRRPCWACWRSAVSSCPARASRT